MRSTQVTTWRKYTAAEKKAYRARVARRRRAFLDLLTPVEEWQRWLIDQALIETPRHRFADGFGSRVPTARVNGQVL